MLIKKNIHINKKYIFNFWFRFVLLSYNYLYFYLINKMTNITLIKKNLLINKIPFIFSNKIPFIFSNNKFYYFLKNNKFIIIYSNNYLEINNLVLDYPIYALIYCSFYLNSMYLNKMDIINKYYSNNLLVIKEYLSLLLNKLYFFIFLFLQVLMISYCYIYYFKKIKIKEN